MKVQKDLIMFLKYQYGCKSSENSEKLKDDKFIQLKEIAKAKVNDKLIVQRKSQK